MASIGEYIKACGGDAYAGVLLHRLDFLCAKVAKVEYEGVKWYIHTRSQWLAELGFSKWQYDHAVSILRELGFIETRIASHIGASQHGKANAWRITEKTHGLFKPGHHCPDGQAIPHGPDVQAHSILIQASSSLLHSKKDTEAGNEPILGKNTGNKIQKSQTQAVIIPPESLSTKAAETIKAIQGQASKLPPHVPPEKLTTFHLEPIYREAYKQFEPAYFHARWTVAMRGRVKQFMAKVGNEQAAAVLGHCVAHWADFRAFVESETEKFIPERPNIPTLQQYAAAAGTFYAKAVTAKDKPKPKPKQVADFK